MLLLFDGKGHSFVKELIRDGPADVDGTIHIGDQVIAYPYTRPQKLLLTLSCVRRFAGCIFQLMCADAS